MNIIRNNDFTDKQIKGIDLCVKAVAKKYKFIKGWQLTENYEQYNSILYINMFVDWLEVADELDVKVNPFYLNYYEDYKKFRSSSLGGHMLPKEIDSIFDLTDEYRNELHNKSFNMYMSITRKLNSFYRELPNNMQIFYNTDSSIMGDNNTLVELSVDNFIQYKPLEI